MIQSVLLNVCRSSGRHSRSQFVEHVQHNTVGADVDHTPLLADAATRQKFLHGKSTQGLNTHTHTHTHQNHSTECQSKGCGVRILSYVLHWTGNRRRFAGGHADRPQEGLEEPLVADNGGRVTCTRLSGVERQHHVVRQCHLAAAF
jgi:hypothetical protein